MSSKAPPRFSTTWKESEVSEIKTFTDATGVDRNELIRRATLAHIRVTQGKAKDHKKAYEQVGSLHDKDKK